MWQDTIKYATNSNIICIYYCITAITFTSSWIFLNLHRYNSSSFSIWISTIHNALKRSGNNWKKYMTSEMPQINCFLNLNIFKSFKFTLSNIHNCPAFTRKVINWFRTFFICNKIRILFDIRNSENISLIIYILFSVKNLETMINKVKQL